MSPFCNIVNPSTPLEPLHLLGDRLVPPGRPRQSRSRGRRSHRTAAGSPADGVARGLRVSGQTADRHARKRLTSATAESGSMSYEACSTACSRQERDVLSMTVSRFNLEEPQVDDADA